MMGSMKKTKLPLILLAVCLLPFPTAVAGEITLVAFGDSTTAVRGEIKIYAGLLADELPRRGVQVKVINAGRGGHNTSHGRARFEKDVLAHDPDVVVIQFGINDAAVDVWKKPPATESRVSLTEYEANLRHFVDTLTGDGVAVILMTPNPLRWNPKMRKMYGKPPYDPGDEGGFSAFLKHYAEKVRDLAEEKDLPLVDVYRMFEEHGARLGQSVDELLLDGVHPNDRGQRKVADALLPLVAKLAQDR
jgi:lysophospholipase L1-like esterase